MSAGTVYGAVYGAPALRVGIVGYGLMGKAHSYGYRVAPMLRRLPVTPVVADRPGRRLRRVLRQPGR
jgi:PII-like signaling protein